MAKKINVSHLLDEFDENISQTNDKKAAQKKKQNNADNTVYSREKGSAWRKTERPIQKTIHFDRVLSNKINALKQWMNNKGEKVSVEDIIYDAVATWMDENFDKIREEYKDYQF